MAYLTLIDGTQYEGVSFGYESDSMGEVVFNTGMTGYQELLTDPSYVGQIVNMTYPLIGNYGVTPEDSESDSPKVKGFIVRDYCEAPSNWKMKDTLKDYLQQNKIVAIHSIDTRALTRKIRESGTMPGIITQQKPTKEQLDALKSYKVENVVEQVTTKEKYVIAGAGKTIAVIDYGVKRYILTCLSAMGFNLVVYPATVTAEEVLADNPDGILLTNGPGDPKENTKAIAEVKKLIGKKPMYGICLGHQFLALAYGGNTMKLKYGHRGSNHPVKDLSTGQVVITSQNHGYAVDPESIKEFGKVSHVNLNDGTVEGIEYNDGMTVSLQFHPESMPGPNDKNYLFERFKKMVENSNK